MPTAVGQGGAAGPFDSGPVGVAVLGSMTVTGMSHMAKRHRLDALKQLQQCLAWDKPSLKPLTFPNQRSPVMDLVGKAKKQKLRGKWEGLVRGLSPGVRVACCKHEVGIKSRSPRWRRIRLR